MSVRQRPGHWARSPFSLFWRGTALFAFWMLLSGKFDAFHLGIGALTAATLVWLSVRLPPLEDPKAEPVRYIASPTRWVAYFGWLFVEIIKSAFYVARVILRPSRHLDPRLIAFRCNQPSKVAAMALANSITVTPGTLTVELEGDLYLVHALTERTAHGLLSGDMQTRIGRLFVDQPVVTVPVELPPHARFN
jgi:multicomponent Na+:H+ antiporter subunit E